MSEATHNWNNFIQLWGIHMSARNDCDYDDEVEALRYDLETLATQARANASSSESFAEALERRLARRHAPHTETIVTSGAAAREPPPEDESDVSSRSGDDDESPQEDELDDAKILSADEGDGKLSTNENSENVLSEDKLDTIFRRNEEIQDEIATIDRLLKRGLSADDLHHVVGREKELLAQLREMREKLQI